MAGLKRTYRIVDGNGRIYLPKSVREEAGMHPGDIIWLEADKSGWIGPVSYTHLDVYKRQRKGSSGLFGSENRRW